MKQVAVLLFIIAVVLGSFAGWQTLRRQNAMFSDSSAVSQSERGSSNPVDELASFHSFPFDFDSTTIDGESLRKSDFAGRVLIVDIWATWCPPCRAEIPSFVELQTKYQDQGLSIVGVNYEHASNRDDAIQSINEFRRNQPINYPLILGDESLTAQVPDFKGFPTTLFIDGTGRVRMMLVGAHPLETLEAYVTTLLAELETPAAVPSGAKQKQQPATDLESAFAPVSTPAVNRHLLSGTN